MSLHRVVLIVLCSVLLVTSASAGACFTTKPVAALDADPVKRGHYADVDRELNQAQHDYEQGKIEDVQLRGHYRFIDGKDPSLEKNYQAWLDRYPRSYAAHLAAGINYMKSGETARGCEYSEETPDASVNAMQAYMQKAELELQKSIGLTTKPLLSLVALMEVEQFTNDPEGARRNLDKANRMAPENFIARRLYMGLLARRWYGDVQEQYKFLDENKEAGVSRDKLDILEGMIHLDVGGDLADDGKFEQALVEFKKMEFLTRRRPDLVSPTGFNMLWTSMAWCYKQMDQYENTLLYADRGLKIDPYSSSLLNSRVYALLKLNRTQEAIPSIKILAEQGDSWAQSVMRSPQYNRSAGQH